MAMRAWVLIGSLAFGAASVLAADETADVRIGARPKSVQNAAEELQALIKRVNTAGPVALQGERSDAVTALINEAKAQPDLFVKLLVPPGFPTSVPKADTEVRIRAATVSGLTKDRRALQPLINSSVYDPDPAVRAAAAKALPLLDEPVALRKLVDIAIMPDRTKFPWPIRKLACQALRRYGDKEAIERVMKELAFELAAGNPIDPKNKLRGRSSGIATENPLAIPESTPDLNLKDEDLYPVLSAMKELTGQSFDRLDKDYKTWLLWWKQERDKFVMKE
jgi:hypothetical protein